MADKKHPEAHLFYVDTRFEKRARRPGGIPREKAIEMAQARIEEIRPGFDVWLDQKLQELSKIIRSAQENPAEPEWVDTAFFLAHQMRNVGTTMGYELLTYVADSLCEVFDEENFDSERNMNSVICHLDALLLSRQEQYRHLRPEQVPELSIGLRRVVERAASDGSPKQDPSAAAATRPGVKKNR
jgi:hypothetical protein